MTHRLPLLAASLLALSALAAADPVPPEQMQGVDFTGLDEAKKKLAVQILNEEGCDCGCGMKLAVCRRDDPTCPRSPGVAKDIVRLVGEGKSRDEIVKTVLAPAYVEFPIAAGSSPAVGPAGAPVTVLHYIDYECPFCVRAAPTMQRIAQEYGDQVRIVYKMHPLDFHKQAKLAAEAALAAHAQGKFLPMHDRLMASSKSLSRERVLAIASEIGLDVPRFTKDIDSGAGAAAIAKETSEVRAIGATGTPATFVNGRYVSGAKPFEAFKALIDEELAWAKSGNRPAFTKGTSVRSTQAGAKKGPDPSKVYDLPVGDSPTQGPESAPVTILHYVDYQCPVCKRVAPTIEEVAAAYKEDVRIVYKMHPLTSIHKQATLAAEAALAAHAQGKFFEMHEKLFEKQATLNRVTIDNLAREIGLDVARFKSDLDAHAFLAQIEQETKEVRAIGSTATPTSFINGRYVVGAQPFLTFKRVVDEELAKKKR